MNSNETKRAIAELERISQRRPFDSQQLATYKIETMLSLTHAPYMARCDEHGAVAQIADVYGIRAPSIKPWHKVADELSGIELEQFHMNPPTALYMDTALFVAFNHERMQTIGMQPIPRYVVAHEMAHAVAYSMMHANGIPCLFFKDFAPWREPHGPMFASIYANTLAILTGADARECGRKMCAFGLDIYDPAEFAPSTIRETVAKLYRVECAYNDRSN